MKRSDKNDDNPCPDCGQIMNYAGIDSWTTTSGFEKIIKVFGCENENCGRGMTQDITQRVVSLENK